MAADCNVTRNFNRYAAWIALVMGPKSSGNVINLMDALKKSLAGAGERKAAPAAKAKGKKKRVEGQREMLLPISGSGSGKRAVKEAPKKAEKPVRAQSKARKAG